MKYKINRNQPPLTDTDLKSARDFRQLSQGYRAMKAPFYRTGKFLTTGSAMIVAAAVALIMVFDDKGDAPTFFISPPLAAATIPIDTFMVEADSATEIKYKSGSTLHIPANAFKDAGGNLIKGKVTLKYREFHDQKDIFLSGIPMTYDSGGVRYIFESAGMMDISASQNGKALAANSDKPIRVDMVSNTKEDRYNTYYLDTISKKWIDLHKANLDTTQFLKQVGGLNTPAQISRGANAAQQDNITLAKYEQQVKQAATAVRAVEKEKPVPLTLASSTKTKFHIVIDPAQFPEIAMYQGVRFQVKDEKHFDQASARIQWEDVRMKKLTGIDYEVTFSKGKQTFKVVATPVVDSKDIAQAKQLYDQKFAAYEIKLAEKKTAEEKAKLEYEAREKELAAQAEKARDRARIYESSLSKTELVYYTCYRSFSVYSFGYYNCDHPIPYPTGASVVAGLTDENGAKLDITCVNLIDKNINAVFSYKAKDGECVNFKFDPAQENILWAITTDNHLAIANVSSFKKHGVKNGKVEFRLRVIDKKFKSSEEVRKYLEI